MRFFTAILLCGVTYASCAIQQPNTSAQTSIHVGLSAGCNSWNGKQDTTYKYVDLDAPVVGRARPFSYKNSDKFSMGNGLVPTVGLFVSLERRIAQFLIGLTLEGGYSFRTDSATSKEWQSFDTGGGGAAFDRTTKASVKQRSTWNFGVLGKIGFYAMERTNIYALLGLNWQHFTQTLSGVDNTVDIVTVSGTRTNVPGKISGKGSSTPMGFVLGLGVRHEITQTLSLALEGKWIQFSNKSYAINAPDPSGFNVLNANYAHIQPGASLGSDQESLSGSIPRYGIGLCLKLSYKFNL